MKRIIQLLFFSILLSCISENRDECPAMRNLVFTHYCLYDKNQDFDHWIANDVMLYVYQNKKLQIKKHIPYEQIRNGKPYSYLKRFGGEVDIVAWAVASGSQTQTPSFADNEDYFKGMINLTDYTRAESSPPFVTDLFLGTNHLHKDDISKESTHTIKMINCACLVNITVNDPGGRMNDNPGKYILVEGTMNQMNLDYQGIGEEVAIRVDFQSEHNGSYILKPFGLLPSADEQMLSFTLYDGTSRLARITTEQKAVSGGRIDIEINLGVSVIIKVNNADWDTYVNVQWM